MKSGFVITLALVSLLSGCATNFSLVDRSDGSVDGKANLDMKVTGEHTAAATLDGKVYEGTWEHQRCTQEICSKYETTSFRHNRHSSFNKAELLAKDGSRLTCEWLNHLGKLKGVCVDAKSKEYRIEKMD